MRTLEIKIGPHQRRAAQRREDAALLWGFPGDRLVDSFSNSRSLSVVFSKPFGQGSDQVSVGIQPKYLKSRHAAPGQSTPVISERSFLGRIAHGRPSRVLNYIQIYIQYRGPLQGAGWARPVCPTNRLKTKRRHRCLRFLPFTSLNPYPNRPAACASSVYTSPVSEVRWPRKI